ncbi:MAG TPA: flippase [Polyangiaceae bacterium]
MSDASESSSPAHNQRLVLRNTAFLVLAQAIVTPLSVLLNALMGRYLGPAEFGELYLASTFVGFGFLFVEWGQGAVLTGRVATERSRAGELLGSSLLFRTGAALLVAAALALLAFALGYPTSFLTVLLLATLGSLFGTLTLAGQDILRGYERTDFAAASYVAYQLLITAVVVPLLWLGARLKHVLIAQAVCAALGLVVTLAALGRFGVPKLRVQKGTVRELVRRGTPFLGFGIALALQPNVDAVFLSKLASEEAIGWHAAARKLIGVLVYPAGALIGALYPTLCRLYAEDRAEYARTARGAFVTTTLLVVPIALCCGLFPDVGVRIFSRESFAPAEDNLRVLSVFLFLVYFSMPLGTCLTAAGRERAWAVLQLGCVAISLALDPLFVSYFQARHGNGGLGVCIAAVISEVLMLSGALYLVPKGIFERALLRRLALAALAGVAMAAVARALSSFSSFVAAPAALLAYAGCLLLTGGIEPSERSALIGVVKRRLRIGK